MPRYFVDTDDDDTLHVDRTGFELVDDAAARQAGLDALPDMARDQIRDGDRRVFVVGIRDDRGEMIYRATLTLRGEWCKRAAVPKT